MTNFSEAETKISHDYEPGCQCPPSATQTLSCLRNMAAPQTLQPSLSQMAGPATQIRTVIGHKTATNRNHDMPGVCGNETAREPESSGPNSEILMLLHTFQNSTRQLKSQGGREMQRKDFASGGCSVAC